MARMRLRGNDRRQLKVPIAAFLIAALLFALPGCGDSEPDRDVLRISYTSFPDALDPAVAISSEAWGALQNSYLPLLTYAHEDGIAGTRLIPGLAKSLPRISDGGRRYELTLRPGLRYSNGRPVRASDFRFAVERLFRLNSPGSPFYTDIVGAERFAAKKEGGISGIEADDRSGRIVIRLRRPRGTFADELALLYVALLPPETPNSPQTPDPPPATGPYEITTVKPGRSWSYRRNPAWISHNAAAMPDLPSGHFAGIEATVISNASTEVNEVKAGNIDWMKGPPPPDRLPELRQRYLGTQFRPEPTISILYFWMNTQAPPFDDPIIRRAVNYAIDREALKRIYAGTISPTQQVLPPQMPGHRRFAFYPHDLAKAKALVASADPEDRDVTVWTDSFSPNDDAGAYYEGVLREIGLQPTLKVLGPTNYFTVIGNQSTADLDTGWGSWLLDYPHPNDYFQPQLSGENILPNGNTNWARFDDPAITARIARLGTQKLGPTQLAAYSELDREVMREAPWVPFGNLTLSTFVAADIDLDAVIFSPIFGQDLTSFRSD